MTESDMFEALSSEAFKTAKARGQYHMLPVLASNPSAKMLNSIAIKKGINHMIGEAYEVSEAYSRFTHHTSEKLREMLSSIDMKDTEHYVEQYDKSLHNSVDDEIADVIINALSVWKALGRDGDIMFYILKAKMLYNQMRED